MNYPIEIACSISGEVYAIKEVKSYPLKRLICGMVELSNCFEVDGSKHLEVRCQDERLKAYVEEQLHNKLKHRKAWRGE